MATYPISNDVDLNLLIALLRAHLRVPDGIMFANGGTSIADKVEYVQTLTAPEETIFNTLMLRARARAQFDALPDWATYTADEATAAITNAIFGGQTQAQVETAITNAITNAPNTTAGVKTVMNTLFIQAADQIITMRGILVIMGKMLVWLRDIVIGRL